MQGIDIFDAGLDGGDLSYFDTGGGSVVTVSEAAALAGTKYGVEFDASLGTNASLQRDITWNTDVVRMRMHFDQNDLVPVDTTARTIFRLTEAGVAVRVQIQVRDATGGSGSLEARFLVTTDVSTSSTSWYAFGTGSHWFEARMIRASTASASDGSITLWIDDVEKETVSSLDIFDVGRPDRVDVTWVGANASDTGSFYGDEYVVRNEDVEIGQVELSMVLAKAGANDGTSDEFDTGFGGGGGVSVSAAAALAGSRYGLAFTLGSATVTSAGVAFSHVWTSRTIRYRFHFDPNGASLADTNLRRIADLIVVGVGARSEALLYSDGGGGYEISARVTLDSGSSETSHYAISDAEHHIEVVVRRATSSSASDGELELWIDGVMKEQKTGLDVWDVGRPDAGRLIWGSGSASDSGTVHSDELEVHDYDGMIGSAVKAEQGVIAVTVGGSSADYIKGSGSYTRQLGPEPSRFEFKTRDDIAEFETVIVNRTWQDEQGNVNRTEKMFQGEVLEVKPAEIGVSGVYEYTVFCSGHAFEAGRTFITKKIQQQASEDVFAIIDNKLPGAFSVDVEAGPDVGPFDLQDSSAPDFAAEVATQAGQIMWITPDKVIRSVAPDSVQGSIEINRVSPSGWRGFDYRRSVGKVRNKIIVRGAEGKAVTIENAASQDAYGGVARPMVFSAHSVEDEAVLTRIGDELAEAQRMPVVEGSVTGRFSRVEVGDNIPVTDLTLRLRGYPVRVTQIEERQLASQQWEQTITFTSERLLARLVPPPDPAVEQAVIRARGPDLKPPAPIKNKPPRVVHRAAVEGPDTAKTASAGEYIGQLRIDQSGGVVRLNLDSTHVGAAVEQGFKIELISRNSLSVSTATVGTGGGEGVVVWDDASKHVTVVSTVSSDTDRWTLNNQIKRVDITITGAYTGARIVVTLWDGDVGSGLPDVMDAFYIGTSEIDSSINISRDVIYEGWLEPQIKSGQIESLDAVKVTEDSARGFVHPTYTNASRQPNKLRRSAADVSAEDVMDLTKEDSDDVGEGTTKLFVGSAGGGDMDDIKDTGITYTKPLKSFMSSNRPFKLWRVTGAEDFDADDGAKQSEVQDNIGGLGSPDLRDGSTMVVDVQNREVENIVTLLDGVDLAATNPVQVGPARAGIIRARNAIDSSYRLAGDIEEGVSGVSDGVSTFGIKVDGSGVDLYADSGTGGGGGTGAGGDPIDP